MHYVKFGKTKAPSVFVHHPRCVLWSEGCSALVGQRRARSPCFYSMDRIAACGRDVRLSGQCADAYRPRMPGTFQNDHGEPWQEYILIDQYYGVRGSRTAPIRTHDPATNPTARPNTRVSDVPALRSAAPVSGASMPRTPIVAV